MLDVLIALRDAIFAALMAWLGADAAETQDAAAAASATDAPLLQIDADAIAERPDAFSS